VVPMTNPLSKRALCLAALSLAAILGCGNDLVLPSSPGEEVDLSMRAASTVSQPGRIGQPVPERPTTLVLDQFGNPVNGAAVDWVVTAGRGSVSSTQTETGPDGKATVTWTLGLGIGVQKLTARVEGAHGSPVTFTATVLF
jgi:hypothetical protein